MAHVLDNNAPISKERLLTAICLIMTLEHNELGLEDLINATGMSFADVRKAMHNLSVLNLVEVKPVHRGVPRFKILNLLDAKNFLKQLGF